jgi:small subunit ribosomal protein S10
VAAQAANVARRQSVVVYAAGELVTCALAYMACPAGHDALLWHRCSVAGRRRPLCDVCCGACFSLLAAAAAPAQQKIRIKLKSYWVDLLGESVEKIKEAASSTGATIAGPVPLPTRKKIYTVLRSPHVNKDSREQFEVRLHQRLIDVKDLTSQTVERLMSLDLPAGVDIEVRAHITHTLCMRFNWHARALAHWGPGEGQLVRAEGHASKSRSRGLGVQLLRLCGFEAVLRRVVC